ncbi:MULTISPECIES: DUF5994 family protein [Mycolicibacterium]|uniref:DUF5994 family protein n=1 Tax=Mycolicibacterium TaxID=1866885 RepID=UPI00069D260D|nr:DUF5994 family protein [Mycolicibacterium smegmatis]MDF1903779.1 DUF5994 family protein [Mycolicibacterium smegmatis]MDF1910342.1 DUF5994 family protein [Mycolicibacterium smegmatis]MDF1922103.1 DUF5994 family protein [Mycolicibacterium smegmatis]MDF1928674.1 DUF5994 family protein [Mycolicibacterium smegmatis]UAK55243.1 DUF5994 family protein [Mycolicibacterium smegmatis]
MTLQAVENSQRVHGLSCTPRLRLKPKAPQRGYVDGAWWPRSDDLSAELPELLAVLSVRLGHVERVLYRLSDWQSAPRKLDAGCGPVKLDGYERQPISTISLLGPGFRRLDLLVIAVYADASDAHATMMRAAHPSDETCVDRLLGIQPRVRNSLDRASIAQQRWESEISKPRSAYLNTHPAKASEQDAGDNARDRT